MKYTLPTLFICLFALIALTACSTKAPELGVTDNGQFKTCVLDDDDCVSSQSADSEYTIEPFEAYGEPEIVMVDLANAIESIFGARVTEMKGNYLRAEFKSPILRTMDDAEFYYDEETHLIHVHALSRGEWLDWDDNRDKIEDLRARFAQRN